MSKEITYDDETQETVYTSEDLAEAIEKAKAEAISASNEELEKLRKVSAEKTENFRKYNEMSQEEKAAYDANTVALMQRSDKALTEVEELRTKLTEKETKEKDYTKSSVLKNYHGDKEDLKKTLEDKYALLAAMPETTPQEIQARASAAATLAGISVNSVNPLYQVFNGEAPQYKEKGEYTETPEGKTAADLARAALGLPVNNK